jgi:hypothetical protein
VITEASRREDFGVHLAHHVEFYLAHDDKNAYLMNEASAYYRVLVFICYRIPRWTFPRFSQDWELRSAAEGEY